MKKIKSITSVILTFSLLIGFSLKGLVTEGFVPTYQEEFELLDKKLVYRLARGAKTMFVKNILFVSKE